MCSSTGKRLWDATGLQRLYAGRADGQTLTTAGGPVELEIEEAGPLRAVILVRGKHRRADGSGYVDLRGRITAYAGKPYIEVEHQFIHAEAEPALSLAALTSGVAPDCSRRSLS